MHNSKLPYKVNDSAGGPPALVSDLRHNHRGTACPQEKLAKLQIDVFVTAANKEFRVFNDLENGPAEMQRLRRNFRTVAIVNAIVSSLEEGAVSFFHVFLGVSGCRPALIGGKRAKSGASDSKDSFFAVDMNDPFRHTITE